MLAASAMYCTAGSGAHATHSRTWSCSLNSALHSAVLTTHTRAVWSLLQLSSNDPSWLDLTCRTHSRWPVKVFTQYLTMTHSNLFNGPSHRTTWTSLYQNRHSFTHTLTLSMSTGAHLVVHGKSRSTNCGPTPPFPLETSGSVLSAIYTAAQWHGKRRHLSPLHDHDNDDDSICLV